MIAALAEARRRGLRTIAMVGYDGGRVAAERLADHVIVTRSQHIPRIQEAQASAYHVLRELVELRVSVTRPRDAGVRARVDGDGAGRRLPAVRLPARDASSGSAAACSTTSAACCSRSRATPRRSSASWRGCATEAPPLAAVEARGDRARSRRAASAASRSSRARAPASPTRSSPPDSATCDDCLAELFDPATAATATRSSTAPTAGRASRSCAASPTTGRSRRWPAFEMCDACRAEYDDPLDRRFHAQPNACPACGPAARLVGRDGGSPAAATPSAARGAARRAIVAVKGLGGYHLACRADDERAVAALRARKHREDKPFALMAPTLEAARALVELGPEEEALLRSAASGRSCSRRAAPDAAVAPSVAPASRELGVMLPYSPLHHLLLADAGAPLVMTSGNVSDEPIAYRDDDALERLGRDRRPLPRPRPPDPDAHRRLGAALGARWPAAARR